MCGVIAITGRFPGPQHNRHTLRECGQAVLMMLTSLLLEKLLEIERRVGHADALEIRSMLMEAEADVLRVQAEMIEILRESARMREKYERCARSALAPVSARGERMQPAGVSVPEVRRQTA